MVSFDKLPCNNYCYLCGATLNKSNATRDHFIAKSVGGSDSVENLRPACDMCNKTKKASSPTVALLIMLYVFKFLRKRFDKRVSRSNALEGSGVMNNESLYVISLEYFGITHEIYFSAHKSEIEVSYTKSLEKYPELLEYIVSLSREAYSHRDYFRRIAAGQWPIDYWSGLQTQEVNEMSNSLESFVVPEFPEEIMSAKEITYCCEICGATLEPQPSVPGAVKHPVCQDCIDYIVDNSLLPTAALLLLKDRRQHLVSESMMTILQQRNDVLMQKLSDMQETMKRLTTQFESVLPSDL